MQLLSSLFCRYTSNSRGSTGSSRRFPYMCSIRSRGDREHLCGGTLIKSRWVLTSAICLDITPSKNFKQTRAIKRMRAAIEEDDSETVQKILCKGLSPKAKFSLSGDNTKWTFMHKVARYNAVKSAKILIDSGADADRKNTLEYTPLHYAAWFGSLQVAEVLVDSGANVDARSDIGQTPLHYAATYNQFDVSNFLSTKERQRRRRTSTAALYLMKSVYSRHAVPSKSLSFKDF